MWPDIDTSDVIRPGDQFTENDVRRLDFRIRRNLLIPNNLVIEDTRGAGMYVGRVIKRESLVSLMGREVPAFHLTTMQGQLGPSYAVADYILIPQEGMAMFEQMVDGCKSIWELLSTGAFDITTFKRDRAYGDWLYANMLGVGDTDENIRFMLQQILVEELSHSDTFFFLEAIGGEIAFIEVEEGVDAMNQALQPTSVLKRRLAEFPHQAVMFNAIIEVEGRLNAIANSSYPAYTFFSCLHGAVLPYGPFDKQDEVYELAHKEIMQIMGEELLGEPTLSQSDWLSYLDKHFWTLDEFNETLKQAAKSAYTEHFLGAEERIALLQHLGIDPTKSTGPKAASAVNLNSAYQAIASAA